MVANSSVWSVHNPGHMESHTWGIIVMCNLTWARAMKRNVLFNEMGFLLLLGPGSARGFHGSSREGRYMRHLQSVVPDKTGQDKTGHDTSKTRHKAS